MNRKKLYCIIGLLVAAFNGKAQDIHFSQFYENAILRNPGLTGIFSGDYKIGADYRSQWGNISAPFQTELVSFETHILVNKEAGDYLSFGLAGTYDMAGTINFNSMQVYPAINYNKALEDVHNSYLSVGFAGGYIERSVDMSKMTFSSQYINGFYNAQNPSGETMPFRSLHAYDVAAGVSLNSLIGTNNRFNYYVGAGLFHINRPSEIFIGADEFSRLPMKWEGNLGFHYAINEQYGVTVHVNYSNEAPYQEWIGGGLLSWRSLSVPKEQAATFVFYIGMFYRYQDAIIPTVKIDYGNLSVNYSYDINNSALQPASLGAGGSEISVYIRGRYRHRTNPEDGVKCPRFEEDVYSAFH